MQPAAPIMPAIIWFRRMQRTVLEARLTPIGSPLVSTGRISPRQTALREKRSRRSFRRKCSSSTSSATYWLMLVARPISKVSPWITKATTRSSTTSTTVSTTDEMTDSLRSLSIAIKEFRTRTPFMAGSPIARPSRYPRLLSSRYAALPVAPSSLQTGVEKANMPTSRTVDMPMPISTDSVNTPLAPSRSPPPINMVKRLRAPEAMMAPNIENTMTTGLTSPNAAIESTPRHWPITMPSISEPKEDVKDAMIYAIILA